MAALAEDPLEREKAAIMAVIEAESIAFYEKDLERCLSYHLNEPHARRWGWWSRGGISLQTGGRTIAQLTANMMARNPAPNRIGHQIRRENVSISVGEDMAWVTFDQHQPEHDEPEMDMPGLCHELRIMEKRNGQWKIALLLYLHRVLEDERGPLLTVNASGRVLWKNAAADEVLKQLSTLEIVDNYLRAVDRGAEQQLRAARDWASRQGALLDVRGGALPIVIEGADGEPATVCWVIAQDGQILISINDTKMSDERLELASVIYGITPAQRLLAGHIVGGLGLAEAAQRLGVTVNTARTQLQRMFEKVGVRSQPALVRALLSIGHSVR